MVPENHRKGLNLIKRVQTITFSNKRDDKFSSILTAPNPENRPFQEVKTVTPIFTGPRAASRDTANVYTLIFAPCNRWQLCP